MKEINFSNYYLWSSYWLERTALGIHFDNRVSQTFEGKIHWELIIGIGPYKFVLYKKTK